MKTLVRNDLQSKASCRSKTYTRQIEKEIDFVSFKLYQKFFVILFSLSTILIFSESPRELENICKNYNSMESCKVW